MVMGNRSFDNLLGGQTLPGLENPIQTGPYCNPLNVSRPGSGTGCTAALDFDSIIDDPDHSISGNNLEFYGSFAPDNEAIRAGTLQPNMDGFLTEQIRLYGAKEDEKILQTQVINYYTEIQVPVITALTQNFAVFNHWHADIPGLSAPVPRPAKSRMTLATILWSKSPSSSKPPSSPSSGRTTSSTHPSRTRGGSSGPTPAKTRTSSFLWMTFTPTPRSGTLPHLAYINPSCCGDGTNSMHPTSRVSDVEQLIKDVYEALRAGPQWNETLWVITFDEMGGFHDHVRPPLAPRPDNSTHTEAMPSGRDCTFALDRLGGRLPTWLVSPWAAAVVEQQGCNADGGTVSYQATSILRTLGYLWGFAPYNPRVRHAPSFYHLIGAPLRTDTPEKFPTVSHFRS